ncbi:MAG: cysteine desulfurase, partial [Planctomycetota bacterium]
MRQVYLDYNSTTPLAPKVKKKIEEYMNGQFGNPSSLHSFGLRAREEREWAREKVAQVISAKDSEILFTSGGTEANALAILGVGRKAGKEGRKHILSSPIEHPSILKCLEVLQKEGFQVEFLRINQDGVVQLEDLEKKLLPHTALVTVMAANNETGAIQAIQEIGRILKDHSACFHCDAVQGLGKMDLDVNMLGVDLMSLSSHKIYGPMGAGALYVRKSVKMDPLIPGHQEKGLRGGTENMISLVGFGEACGLLLEKDIHKEQRRIRDLRDGFYQALKERFPFIRLNTPLDHSLANTLNLEFPRWEGERLLFALDMAGIAVSLGSACSSGSLSPSHVLTAMGRTP